MLPPGIGFNAISPRALEAAKTATLPRAFWSWEEIVAMNADGYWPTTPNTNLLYGLNEALEMLLGEGLDNVFARHQRWAAGRPRRRRGVAAADPVRRGGAPIAGADGRDHAGRRRRRCGAPPDLRALRPLARHRPRQGQGPHVPHRPPRRQQRPHPARHRRRLRDGAEARRRAPRRRAACRPRMDHFASHPARAGLAAAA